MVRALARFALVFALLAVFAAPVRAGGMATVHLDAPPQDVVVGVPFEIGMMVMQHDITPVKVVTRDVRIGRFHWDGPRFVSSRP